MNANKSLPGSSTRPAVALALVVLLAVLFAETSWSAPGASRVAGPANGLFFAVAFSMLVSATFVLIAAMAVPAAHLILRMLRRLAWPCARVAAEAAVREVVKWALLAGAAYLGVLNYLEWLPHAAR